MSRFKYTMPMTVGAFLGVNLGVILNVGTDVTRAIASSIVIVAGLVLDWRQG